MTSMQTVLADFQATTTAAVSVSNKVHQTDSNGAYLFPVAERSLISQAAFVGIYVGFEEYIEASFGHYGMGFPSLAGVSAPSYVSAPDLEHLHRMFVGTARFVDWATPDVVRRLSVLFFPNGEPFESTMAGFFSDLQDFKTVRNAASHKSRSTAKPMSALYVRWTGQAKVNPSAYELLTAHDAGGNHTFMAHAEKTFNRAAHLIANHA